MGRWLSIGKAAAVFRSVNFEQLTRLFVLALAVTFPLYALTRFGKWDEILAEPAPAEDLKYPTGVWHYARGIAFTAKGQLQEAARELETLKAIAADPSLEKLTIWNINKASSILQIASDTKLRSYVVLSLPCPPCPPCLPSLCYLLL